MISVKEISRLYLNRKMSVSKIASVLNCSENKVNYWMNYHGIKKRSISEAIYLKNNPDGDPFSVKKLQNFNKKEAILFGLGIGLYWGEGNRKSKNAIRLGNSNPELILKFIEFLVKIFSVKPQKLLFGLQIFSDINPVSCLNHWLNYLKKYGINRRQFFKVTVTKSRSLGTYREKSKYGVLTVHFCNTKLKKIFDNLLPK